MLSLNARWENPRNRISLVAHSKLLRSSDEFAETELGSEMVALSDADLQIMVGPDFKRIMQTSSAVTVTSTAEQHAASRALRKSKLSDLNLSYFAVMFTGVCLLLGAQVNGSGTNSVQGLMGVGMALLAVVGLAFNYSRSQILQREEQAAL